MTLLNDRPISIDITSNTGTAAIPAIGQSVQIAGAAVVVALRQDGDCRSMELQITDLGVDAGRKTKAGVMYPSANED